MTTYRGKTIHGLLHRLSIDFEEAVPTLDTGQKQLASGPRSLEQETRWTVNASAASSHTSSIVLVQANTQPQAPKVHIGQMQLQARSSCRSSSPPSWPREVEENTDR